MQIDFLGSLEQVEMVEEIVRRVTRRHIVSSLRFMRADAEDNMPEITTHLDIAIRCLETAYDIEPEFPQENDPYVPVPPPSISPSPAASPSSSPTPESINLQYTDNPDAEDYNFHGIECHYNGSFLNAIEQYSKAIELNSEDSVYFCNRAVTHFEIRNYNETVQDCKRALQLEPDCARSYGYLGMSYFHLSKLPEAVVALQKACDLASYEYRFQAYLSLLQRRMASEANSAYDSV